MSSSDPTTSSELIQLIPTVEFQVLFRDRVFGTEAEMFNYHGSVTHWLLFNTQAPEFGSGLDYIVVSGSSQDFLSGTLPEKIYIDSFDFSYNATAAHVIASKTEANDGILKLPPSGIKKYLNSTYLLTRVDSGDENNREILFVSNGTMTTMFPDVFFRELTATITSPNYDESSGTTAESGWYIGMCSDVELLTDTFEDQELVTNSSVDLIDSTTVGLIQTSSAPPLLRWASETDDIHTFESGETAPTRLIVDFSEYPAISFKGDQADTFIVWIENEETNNSIVLGAGLAPMLDEPSKTTCALSKITAEFSWDELIII